MEEHDQPNPYAPPASSAEAQFIRRFSVPLAILLLVFIVGAFALDIAFGVGILMLAIPAYARALRISSLKARTGVDLSATARLLGFLGSVGVVVACVIAGCIAFFATCTGALATELLMTEVGGIVSIILCGLGFLLAAGLVYWAAWPKRRTVSVPPTASAEDSTSGTARVRESPNDDEAKS